MIKSQSQPTERNDKLPIERPLREALGIYFYRLKIFFVIIIINIFIFIFFVALQHFPAQSTHLQTESVIITLTVAFTVAIASLMGGIISASTQIKAASIKKTNRKASNNGKISRSWIVIFIGALIGAIIGLLVVRLFIN